MRARGGAPTVRPLAGGGPGGYPQIVLARFGSLEGLMKRLAMAAFLLLAVSTVQLEARPLPKSPSLTDRDAAKSGTHYVRGSKKVPQAARDADRKSHRDLHQTHHTRGK